MYYKYYFHKKHNIKSIAILNMKLLYAVIFLIVQWINEYSTFTLGIIENIFVYIFYLGTLNLVYESYHTVL